MKQLSTAIFLCLALFWSCDKENIAPQPAPKLNCGEQQELCELSAANNQFGFDLFRELQREKPDKNIFISPVSIGTALAMTMNGTAGATKDEMLQTMQLNRMDTEGINAAYQTLIRVLPKLDPKVQAVMANSVWYRQGFPVLPGFLATCEDKYSSEVRALDFNDPNSVKVINGWVNDKTKGKINQIIDQIPSSTVMYLINAIYFKGAWKKTFDPKKTAKSPFYLQGGGETEVDLMNHGGIRLPYYENDLYQAVDLAYGGEEAFSMTVLLPKEGVSTGRIIAGLSQGDWAALAEGLKADSIIFSMPAFEMKYQKNLNSTLQQLGIKKAFTGGEADFSKMAQNVDLFISEVRHKSFIKVNEEGTEAAAVTSVGIDVTSVPLLPVVVLNRPFLFAIREKATNSVLFIGQMMDPNDDEEE